MNTALAAALEILIVVMIGGYILSGIDDLVLDVVYWARRLFRGRYDPPVKMSELLSIPEKRAAIFIPAWHEGEVIWETLVYNGEVINYESYDIFVGTYPNDEETQRYVNMARKWLKNVHISIAEKDGPTTKADNLNAMFRTMEKREAEQNIRYDFVVLHDAEDVLHPLELRVLNYHFESGNADMIQTPIFPLPTPKRQVTVGTYMDQFAEVQTKDMYVRTTLKAFVPSCGVATGFTRRALDCLEERGEGGLPFDADALTEDYEVGLKLALAGMRGRYLRQVVIDDMPDREIRMNPVTPDPRVVATWSNYPTKFGLAVRQRSRWALGIVFQTRRQESDGAAMKNRWLLFHDRKQLWAYPLVALGYLLMAAYLGVEIARGLGADITPFYRLGGLLQIGAIVTVVMMGNRLLQRAIATGRVYGIGHGLMSIVRQPWDNLINIFALYRAAKQFLHAKRNGGQLAWDKTTHVAPTILRPKLGHLMMKRGWLTPEQLQNALMRQRDDHKPLGDLLVELGYISEAVRDEALHEQEEAA